MEIQEQHLCASCDAMNRAIGFTAVTSCRCYEEMHEDFYTPESVKQQAHRILFGPARDQEE